MKRITLMVCAFAALTYSSNVNGQANWSNTVNTGLHSTALGQYTESTGSHSTALGFYSKSVGAQSFAAGHYSRSAGSYSFALGARARTEGTHAMAFGLDVRANANNSMIIGTGVGNGSSNSMHNDITNSLMIGFKSTIPTLFVGSSNGIGTIGRVGIGTSTPDANLHIKGIDDNPNIYLTNASGNSLEMGIADCNGCFSSHATTGDAILKTVGGGNLIFSAPVTSGEINLQVSGYKAMTIKDSGSAGKVGVGTTNFPTSVGGTNISAYRLFVKGGILTEELRVNSGWADYVFNDDYELKPLSEVQSFIEENGHLPNVPSAEQVETEGINVGEMTRIQQEKIEELTLYIIDQQEKLDQLTHEVELLKEKTDEK